MPTLWLLGLFAVSVGLPFFAVSINAPLLQHWFAHTGHETASDPYYLYGASNLGSILALLAYPFFMEPFFTLKGQTLGWTVGFAILIALIGGCAVMVRRHQASEGVVSIEVVESTGLFDSSNDHSSWGTRLHWMALAFVPSSLLLGVTTLITTDVAAVPLFWVIPLVLYLLTFVIVFARRPWIKHDWVIKIEPFLLILIASIPIGTGVLIGFLALHLLVFFIVALACHGELARHRPKVSGLTEFYLFLSIGGMLGGVFNAIIAPIVFNSILEYPIALVLACLLRPALFEPERFFKTGDLLVPSLVAGAFLAIYMSGNALADLPVYLVVVFLSLLAPMAYSCRFRPLQMAVCLGTILVGMSLVTGPSNVLVSERSFFGVSRVTKSKDGRFFQLVHGTTFHGAQHTDPAYKRRPLAYFHPEGPLGPFFGRLNETGSLKNVAVLGLGAGAIGCYRKPDQRWTFYEIDPVVVKLARDTRYFQYVSQCLPEDRMVLGDGRLMLEDAPEDHYDLLVLDAFSSDSVPVHLLTREAFQTYTKKLAKGGLILMNISNRHVTLEQLMANLVADSGFVARINRFRRLDPYAPVDFAEPLDVDWLVIARDEKDLARLSALHGWQPLVRSVRTQPWSDDYSNILETLHWWAAVKSWFGA
jgi:hypothetical protein